MKAKNTWFRKRYIAYVVAALLVFAWTSYIAASQNITGSELNILRFFNNWPQGLRWILLTITQAGSEWMLFGVTLVLLGLKRNRLALRFFSSGAAAFLLSQFAKAVIDRPRPYYILTNIHVREYMRVDSGFPSSHTAVATAAALVIMYYIPRRWRWLCWLWITLVGVSRIYLGVHAPLDVVGGFCIGAAVVYGSFLVHGKLKAVLKITKMKLQR